MKTHFDAEKLTAFFNQRKYRPEDFALGGDDAPQATLAIKRSVDTKPLNGSEWICVGVVATEVRALIPEERMTDGVRAALTALGLALLAANEAPLKE